MGSRDGAPAHKAPRRRLRFGKYEAAPPGLDGLEDFRPRSGQIAGGHIREVGGDSLEGHVGIKITDDEAKSIITIEQLVNFVGCKLDSQRCLLDRELDG